MIMMRRGYLILLFVGGAALKAEEPPISVPAFGPRFKEIHERIEALYSTRNGTYPLPDPGINLFRLAAERAVVAEVPKEPIPTETLPDADTMLREATAPIKGGIVKASGDTAYFVANRKNYREGDLFVARFRGKPVTLTIKRVTATSVTFALDGAEVTISANQLR
jgi:hypothetical protein